MIWKADWRSGIAVVAAALALTPMARAGEHVTLRNGSEFDCVRREPQGDKVRLYLRAATGGAGQTGAGQTGALQNEPDQNYVDVAADAVARVETVPDAPAALPGTRSRLDAQAASQPTRTELNELLAKAGLDHNVDAELLASVVHAESDGRVQAVSRTGARGLMQLMPGTASKMGVHDAFVADQNVEGGTRYLDALLTRYHDNIALALAAYNAGPAAVDRYRGVPPYHETRAYVARVIREFNRRKTTLLAQAK